MTILFFPSLRLTFFPPAVWFSWSCVCPPYALLSIHSPPLLCLLLNLKACGSVRETARLREVISSSKQTAALYNMFSAHINCTLPPSSSWDLLLYAGEQMEYSVHICMICWSLSSCSCLCWWCTWCRHDKFHMWPSDFAKNSELFFKLKCTSWLGFTASHLSKQHLCSKFWWLQAVYSKWSSLCISSKCKTLMDHTNSPLLSN